MAIAIARPYNLDERQEASLLGNYEQDVEEEDEALSLCDLPIEFGKEEKNHTHNKHQSHKSEEEFDFGLWARSLSTVEHRISAADELFFEGQILPLRHSVSSEVGGILLGKAYKDSSTMTGRDISRCESMDNSSISRFTSISSRSSSIGSHHSSSSSTVTGTTTTTTTNTNTPSTVASIASHGTARNRFHDYPSPKPQIRMASNNLGNVPSRNSKSSVWEFFRIGLVRTPDIELQDLKHRTHGRIGKRCSVSRNSSTSSSSQTNPNPSTSPSPSPSPSPSQKKISQKLDRKQNGVRRMGFFRSSSGSFLGGCKCSVDTVTVPSNIPAMKSSERDQNREVDETLQEWKMKMKKKMEIKQKQAMSRYRTFEWLKELSHGSLPQEM